MRINKNEYSDLIKCKIINGELKKEIQRLASLISEQVKDCKVGPWCKDCKYMGKDESNVLGYDVLIGWYDYTDGKVTYCKKHLQEICPEFEIKD